VPISSSDIGQIFAQQQAQFGNAAAYSEQVAQQYGLSEGKQTPTYGTGGFHDPRTPPPMPHAFGSRVGSGAIGGALAVGAAANIGASLYAYSGPSLGNFGDTMFSKGGARGFMDPFVGIGRAATRGFWGGARLNRKMVGGAGGIGATARTAFGLLGEAGGVGRVAGGMASGLVAGGVMALPYLAAGAAMDFTAGHIMGGAQQFGDTQSMLQNVTRSQMPGMTGKFGTGASSNVTNMLRGMAGSDPMASMADMQGLMGGMISGGMMRGAGDLSQFKAKFKEMSNLVKEVAQVFHTSLQDALPIIQQQQALGFHTTGQIRQGMRAMQGAAMGGGMSTAETFGVAAQGSQLARAYGASGSVGAMAATGMASELGSGELGGIFSAGQLAELGGRSNVAMRLTGRAFQTARGRMGRHIVGALMDPGSGELDPDAVASFRSGTMSRQDMLKRFRSNMSSRSARAALRNNFAERSAEAVQQVGVGGFIRGAADMVLAGHEDEDDNVQSMRLQKVMGVGRREADVIQRMAQDTRQEATQRTSRLLTSERQRQTINSRRLEAKFAQAKEAVLGPVGRDLEALGQAVSEATNEMTTSVLDAITGTHTSTTTKAGSSMMRDILTGRRPSSLGAPGQVGMSGSLTDNQATALVDRSYGAGKRLLAGALAPDGNEMFQSYLSSASGAGMSRSQALSLPGATTAGEGMSSGLVQEYIKQVRTTSGRGIEGGDLGSAIGGLGEFSQRVAGGGSRRLQRALSGSGAGVHRRRLALARAAQASGDLPEEVEASLKQFGALEGMTSGAGQEVTDEDIEEFASQFGGAGASMSATSRGIAVGLRGGHGNPLATVVQGIGGYFAQKAKGLTDPSLGDFMGGATHRESSDKLIRLATGKKGIRLAASKLNRKALSKELEMGEGTMSEALHGQLQDVLRTGIGADSKIGRRPFIQDLQDARGDFNAFQATQGYSNLNFSESQMGILATADQAGVRGPDGKVAVTVQGIARQLLDSGASPQQMSGLGAGGDIGGMIAGYGAGHGRASRLIAQSGKRGGMRGFKGQMRTLMGSEFVKENDALLKQMYGGEASITDVRTAFGGTFGDVMGAAAATGAAEGGFSAGSEQELLVKAKMEKGIKGPGTGTKRTGADQLASAVEKMALTTEKVSANQLKMAGMMLTLESRIPPS
jgi:hypothetical protein